MTALSRSPSWNGVDTVAAIGLATVSVAYLLSFPHRLGAADEGLILYEAKRLLAGDVYFRDLFEIIPPGSQYLVAGAFWLFGTTIQTARAVDAAVQVLITVLVYACARAAGVRRPLAVVAALLQPVLCEPVWPYVSPHWISTALALVLLRVCLCRPWARRPAGAAAAGFVLGLMALVQQQRAVMFAIAVAGLLILDALVAPRFGERTAAATVAARIVTCGAVAMVTAVLPLMAAATSGIAPIVRALVIFPLVNYRSALSAPWGAFWLITGQYAQGTYPVLLRWAPVALVALTALAAMRFWRRDRLAEVRMALAIVVIGTAQIGAISYFPDLIHLAFLAPLCVVAAALAIEWMVSVVPLAGAATTAACIVSIPLLGWRAAELRARAWAHVAASAPTAFGRIDFDNASDPSLVAAVSELANQDPERRLLCYPGYPALYLMTDTRNPTPFQILVPGYSTGDQLTAARELVERSQVPLVVIDRRLVHADDQFVHIVAQRYLPVPGQPLLWKASPPPARPSPS